MNQTVDFQIIVPRAQDVSRIQHIQQRNEQAQQQCFAVHLAHESERAQKSVQNPPHTREARIKEKEHKDKWSMKHHQKKPSNEETEETNKEKRASETDDEIIKSGTAHVGRYIDLKI